MPGSALFLQGLLASFVAFLVSLVLLFLLFGSQFPHVLFLLSFFFFFSRSVSWFARSRHANDQEAKEYDRKDQCVCERVLSLLCDNGMHHGVLRSREISSAIVAQSFFCRSRSLLLRGLRVFLPQQDRPQRQKQDHRQHNQQRLTPIEHGAEHHSARCDRDHPEAQKREQAISQRRRRLLSGNFVVRIVVGSLRVAHSFIPGCNGQIEEIRPFRWLFIHTGGRIYYDGFVRDQWCCGPSFYFPFKLVDRRSNLPTYSVRSSNSNDLF